MCNHVKPSNGHLKGEWYCVSDHSGELLNVHVMHFRQHPLVSFSKGFLVTVVILSAILFWILLGMVFKTRKAFGG